MGDKLLKLTPKKQEFVRQYLIDLNGTQAAIRAGYSEKTANEQASRLLSTVKIQEALVELREELTKKGKIASVDEILESYTKSLRFDPRKLYDDTGTPLSPHELDDDTAMALAGMDVTEKIIETATKEGSNTTSFRNTKYKYPDKKGILDSLARIHGLFNDKLNVSGDKDEPICINITLNRS
jgi:phage terminase small subunit